MGLRARVGFSPKTPQHEAGIRMEPPASLACAIGTIRAATAAADPPEDPPVVYSGAQGLIAGPYMPGSQSGFMPNSGVFVLPSSSRPASRQRVTSSLSCVER